MTRELFWLTLTVILTGVFWVPYIINRTRFAASPAPWPIRRATTSRTPNGRRG